MNASADPANPTVSVVMPVHNGSSHLGEAIESILGQTFKDFELIIVNDGSTDSTPSILKAYAKADSRVVTLSEGRIGLVRALNLGIERSRGRYIARMDADDISAPSRISMQLACLKSQHDIAILGTGVHYMAENGQVMGQRRMVTDSMSIASSFFFGNPIAHPTVMFDRARIREHELVYVEGFPQAEDLELWLRLTRSGYRAKNLRTALLYHREHLASVTAAHGSSGRESSVQALVASSQWRPGLSRWIADRTFNASNSDISWGQFLAGTTTLLLVNLIRPDNPRWHLMRRAALAVGARFRPSSTHPLDARPQR